jgi:nitroreductase
MTIAECIRQRTSQRSYQPTPLRGEHRHLLEDYIAAHTDNPFHVDVRIKLIDLDGPLRATKLGTYGIISGATTFLAGAAKRGPNDMVGFGYCFEQVVLSAQSLGLGTCWLGGTFTRSAFAAAMTLQSSEILPCISPVGYPRKKRTLRDRVMRYFAGSKNRRPWQDIFFDNDFTVALTESQAGKYKPVLEMVRLTPSSTNRQPWRIVKTGNGFHFYVLHTGKIATKALGFDMQKIDMGIALCHFDAVARELGLAGHWTQEQPALAVPAGQANSLEYLFSWKSL